jgi:hypothetical protein
MNATEEIKLLQEQIDQRKKEIANCKHIFGKPVYNPEIIKVPYGIHMQGHGSDVWGEPDGYRDESYSRWTRTCSICGKEEHTNKQKDIVVGREPDFK